MTYRVELDERVLKQLGGFPGEALDALVATMAEVVEYPDDPMRTFPTGDSYVRCAEFGGLGLVTYVINDARLSGCLPAPPPGGAPRVGPGNKVTNA